MNGLDPVAEALLLALAKAAPAAIIVVADALKGGESPEQAVAKARLAVPPRIDTRDEDDTRRQRLVEREKSGT